MVGDQGSVPPLADTAVAALPTTTLVQLERTPGKSWGVLLSREGDMCLVARGSSNASCGLQKGDVILQAENEAGVKAHVAYRQVVDLFKASRHLKLQVQRVTCSA